MFYWIAHVLVLGGLIFFLSGDDDVDWQRLIWMVFLMIIPGNIVASLLFGDSYFRDIAGLGILFSGLAFVMKIRFEKAGIITAAFCFYLVVSGVFLSFF